MYGPGRSVGKAECGGLEGREGRRGGGKRQGSREIADDCKLLRGEPCVDANVRMVEPLERSRVTRGNTQYLVLPSAKSRERSDEP